MEKHASLTYASYLKIDQILTAQDPKSGSDGQFEHDEMLFIIIHQVWPYGRSYGP